MGKYSGVRGESLAGFYSSYDLWYTPCTHLGRKSLKKPANYIGHGLS